MYGPKKRRDYAKRHINLAAYFLAHLFTQRRAYLIPIIEKCIAKPGNRYKTLKCQEILFFKITVLIIRSVLCIKPALLKFNLNFNIKVHMYAKQCYIMFVLRDDLKLCSDYIFVKLLEDI